MRIPRRITVEMAARMLADTAAINFSLFTALVARFIILFAFQAEPHDTSAAAYAAVLHQSLLAYRDSAVPLTLLCLTAFFLSGFYTFGRAYRGRYKALLIFQAVSVAYLLFAFSLYVLRLAPIPRSALVGSWALSLLLVGGLRVGASVWRRAVWAEAKMWGVPEKRSVRNVLVIGGAGYIGSLLVPELLNRGYNTTVLDALMYGDESIRDLRGRHGFELIHDDMRNIEAVVRSMQYADAVVHLGALVGDPACAVDENLTLEINLAATRMIAETARGFGIRRLIFASTCSVYGASDQVLDERSALNPVSLYARTKIGSEQLLLNLNSGFFAPTILRFGTIYGLSPRPRFDLVVNLLAAKAVCEKEITIFGGSQWRPFVHVRDAAEAILKCIEAPLDAVRGQIFNVGCNDQNFQIAHLGDLVQELIPGVRIDRKGDDTDRRDYRVSFAKIQRHLGFKASHTVRDGVLEIKAALESSCIKDYQSPKYNNYKIISEGGNTHFIRNTHISPLYSVGHDRGDRLWPSGQLVGAISEDHARQVLAGTEGGSSGST